MAITEGFDIFVDGIPKPVQESRVRECLHPYLQRYGVVRYELSKGKGKGFAFIYCHDFAKGQAFLNAMQNQQALRLSSRFPLRFKRSSTASKDDKFVREKMAQIEASKPSISAPTLTKPSSKQLVFPTTTLSCGAWEYRDSESVFVPYCTLAGSGRLLMGNKSLVILIDHPYLAGKWQHRLDISFNHVTEIFTSRGNTSSAFISCVTAPKFYNPDDNPFPELQNLMSNRSRQAPKKIRVPALNEQHGKVAGICFIYEVILDDHSTLHALNELLKSGPEMPSTIRMHVRSVKPSRPLDAQMEDLRTAVSGDRQGTLPFSVRFQALRIARDGHLPPNTVTALIPEISQLISEGASEQACADALRHLFDELDPPHPSLPAGNYSTNALIKTIKESVEASLKDTSVYRTVKAHSHLAPIHHARITPSGLYLEGPTPEVTNRVLRSHSDNIDSFIRITFSDEDGGCLEVQYSTNNDVIWNRIQSMLNNPLRICGKDFTFLGFSQSSMKSHTAWYMAPFFDTRTQEYIHAADIIKNIGEFSSFRSPAKCAARIGQAFTDTHVHVVTEVGWNFTLNDVERNDRCFSDGCGLISPDLADRIMENYPGMRGRPKVDAFQIRFLGFKGVLARAPTLLGEQLYVRPSMKKFHCDEPNHLEICGIADKPLTLYLNRPLIKVLEDLGVPPKNIFALAENQMADLLKHLTSAINIAGFLETERIGDTAGLPGLIQHLDDIQIPVEDDNFLRAVVELAAIVRLRELKYKGRISVEKGMKLMGAMDDTGTLRDGEIYCPWLDSEGHRQIFVGKVAITRSPTNHPGDVQIAQSVDVSWDSPLRELHNLVLFSKYGERDLPSQLGGGDLDGDMYDIFWEPLLMPPGRRIPANYPRLPAIDIGREITARDITTHFVDFMKSDNVGLLSNHLLILSDRLESGTIENECIAIAELISNALDFPKTGIKPRMENLPKFDRRVKPDFMAPGPHVTIDSLEASLKFAQQEEKNPHDPVASLDPDQRKVGHYKSEKVLGQLYRMVDEKGFYEQLRANTHADAGNPSSVMRRVLDYVLAASEGVLYKQYIDLAANIRSDYEATLDYMTHDYSLHPGHPLHEVEVVSGCALGSIFNRRLKDSIHAMREQFSRDIAHTRSAIQTDNEGNIDEALPRAIACLWVAINRTGMKKNWDGKKVELKSFGYVAAAVCLEELERFHGGHLRRFKV